MAFLWDISHAVHERRLIPGFLTAAFYNFLLLSFQTKANIKRKILELLSACGKMKKHNNSQGCGRTVSELNTVLCLTSTYQSWSAIRSRVGYPQKCIRNNILTVTVFTVTSFTSGSLLQMSSSHQCRVSTAVNKIPVPATGMSHPRHAQTSSIRKAKAWAALAKAAGFLGCQQRPEAIPRLWRKGEISAQCPPHPHSAEASPVKATSHHQHMEVLAGVCILSDRWTDLIRP